jgi:hypothetical protein
MYTVMTSLRARKSHDYNRMDVMRTILISGFVITLGLSPVATAQSKNAVEQKLISEYALTQPTADQFDIVTAGAILVLKKGNIVMAPTSGTDLYQNTYRDGKISGNAAAKVGNALGRFSRLPGASGPAPPPTRTFVPGEKVWVTKIVCKDDGVVFDLFTDAYADVRYKAALKIAFPKTASPAVDMVDKLVAEVFKVQADDGGGGGQQGGPQATPPQQAQQPPQPAAPVQKQAAPAAMAPIAPPPPPPPVEEPQGPPKTLKIGQSKDEVVAAFGQPEKVVKLGTKEIYYYKDLGKVTFVNGKVTDVQ